MRSSVYVETTIPSLLTAWPSRDLQIAAQQQATREWWEQRRHSFNLFVSPVVMGEAAQGDGDAARERVEVLAGLPVLAVNEDVEDLTARILATGLIPPKATRDAAHIGFAAAYRIDFLLTWNCRHIHNATIERQLARVCEGAGFELPVICTPSELMSDSLMP